jgi:hypothetical protein
LCNLGFGGTPPTIPLLITAARMPTQALTPIISSRRRLRAPLLIAITRPTALGCLDF